jgi:hypothetical protein
MKVFEPQEDEEEGQGHQGSAFERIGEQADEASECHPRNIRMIYGPGNYRMQLENQQASFCSAGPAC